MNALYCDAEGCTHRKPFFTKKSFRMHLDRHTNPTAYTCKNCGKMFASKRYINGKGLHSCRTSLPITENVIAPQPRSVSLHDQPPYMEQPTYMELSAITFEPVSPQAAAELNDSPTNVIARQPRSVSPQHQPTYMELPPITFEPVSPQAGTLHDQSPQAPYVPLFKRPSFLENENLTTKIKKALRRGDFKTRAKRFQCFFCNKILYTSGQHMENHKFIFYRGCVICNMQFEHETHSYVYYRQHYTKHHPELFKEKLFEKDCEYEEIFQNNSGLNLNESEECRCTCGCRFKNKIWLHAHQLTCPIFLNQKQRGAQVADNKKEIIAQLRQDIVTHSSNEKEIIAQLRQDIVTHSDQKFPTNMFKMRYEIYDWYTHFSKHSSWLEDCKAVLFRKYFAILDPKTIGDHLRFDYRSLYRHIAAIKNAESEICLIACMEVLSGAFTVEQARIFYGITSLSILYKLDLIFEKERESIEESFRELDRTFEPYGHYQAPETFEEIQIIKNLPLRPKRLNRFRFTSFNWPAYYAKKKSWLDGTKMFFIMKYREKVKEGIMATVTGTKKSIIRKHYFYFDEAKDDFYFMPTIEVLSKTLTLREACTFYKVYEVSILFKLDEIFAKERDGDCLNMDEMFERYN